MQTRFLNRVKFKVAPSRGKDDALHICVRGPQNQHRKITMTIAQAPKKGKELHDYQDREIKKDRTKLTAFVSEPQAIYPSAMDSPMKFCNKKSSKHIVSVATEFRISNKLLAKLFHVYRVILKKPEPMRWCPTKI
jgi:hypothetical protein